MISNLFGTLMIGFALTSTLFFIVAIALEMPEYYAGGLFLILCALIFTGLWFMSLVMTHEDQK
ncbi:hypothetical protein [Nitrosopumilus spindle-shaped virus]|uniref:Uncharacterized protein n=1 Tax=Nitrosopumilus spindle-shaped virus TaxID=2508184 RepID=A0A514K4M1_9VIRU|nr:hypothetical protein [Nitrosopumilus spindle-shaped virus]